MGSPERPKGNIFKKAAKIGIPVAILTSQAACGGVVYDINFPPCDIDPQSKTETLIIHANEKTPHGLGLKLQEIKIEGITIKKANAGIEIDIDQSKQPEEHRIEVFPDGHMEFRGVNGRTYSISKRPSDDLYSTELTIQADCETPKTNS